MSSFSVAIAIAANIVSIIFAGEYLPMDGPDVHEDSAIYDAAYQTAEWSATL